MNTRCWRDCWHASPGRRRRVLVGPGDDAAVLTHVRNERLVVTTDALVEGVHFSRPILRPGRHRAQGARRQPERPGGDGRDAALGAALAGPARRLAGGRRRRHYGRRGRRWPGGTGWRWSGATSPGRRSAGGGCHRWVATCGRRRWLTRGGARPGDAIYVSGTLGRRQGGARDARQPGTGSREPADGNRARPTRCDRAAAATGAAGAARAAIGRARAARAAMDLSDGLADALRQVAAASGCGVRVDAAALPIEPGARAWWTARGRRSGERGRGRRRGLRAAVRGPGARRRPAAKRPAARGRTGADEDRRVYEGRRLARRSNATAARKPCPRDSSTYREGPKDAHR